jgi:vitamin B12/bleomycin/antimicrobial peptide transport system ATP-binding/permease protein
VGVNPDQRIHEEPRRLAELSADLGIGLLQASLLLLSFLCVLWTISGALDLSICGISLTIPGYMVWCALLYAASGSWLTWRVGRRLVDMNSRRYQRESEFRFALFQANQQIRNSASHFGRSPGLVDEDQTFGIEITLAFEPRLAPLQDVGAVLLGRGHGLFCA